MKPENAIPLPIASDLAETSFENAAAMLNEVSKKMRFGYFNLKIPSQLVGRAMLLTMDEKVSIFLDCSYDPDEWSLQISGVEDGKSGPELRKYEVWSAGA